MALSWEKVYPVIKSHCLDEEQELIGQLRRLEQQDTHFTSFGCNQLFSLYQPSKQIYEHLQAILKKRSPIEMIYLCKKILDRINDELNEFLTTKLYSPFSKSKYEVLTDDLVAIVVYILIKFNLNSLNKNLNPFLVSEIRYMQTFSFYLHMQSAYGYSLTTFEVAYNYIKDYHFESDETPTKTNGQTSTGSKSKSLNGSVRSLNSRRTTVSSETIDEQVNNANKKEVRKQLNFSSVKLNEDLEKITKLITAIEDTSFSFQQLENAEKND